MWTTCLLFSAFWFWLSSCRKFTSPDLESDQPVIQQTHGQPYRHPAITLTTQPTISQPPVTSTKPVIDQPPVDHLSSTDLHIIPSINVHLFSCNTVTLAFVSSLSWLFILIHIGKLSRVDILISFATRGNNPQPTFNDYLPQEIIMKEALNQNPTYYQVANRVENCFILLVKVF